PDFVGEVNRCIGWNNVNGDYNYYDNKGSPDYFNILSTNNSWTTPFEPIIPYSGNGQMGLVTYSIYGTVREYISAQLSTSMIPGHKYTVSFYLTNGTIILGNSNNFGIHFSNNPLFQAAYYPISVVPQIEINTIINACNYWQHFSFIYIADSSYKYITIGNFRDDSNTMGNSYDFSSAYYFIDKIEMFPYKLTINGDSVICSGNTVTLKIKGDSIVKWADSLNPNIIIATDSMITITPLTTTTYVAFNTSDTAYYTVYVYNVPQVNIGNDTTLCTGQILTLKATNQNSTYLWQNYSTDSTYKVSQSGTYWLTVTTNNNCSASDTINVTYIPNPIVNLGSDTTICKGVSMNLNATTPNATYLWNNGSTDSIYNVTSSGTYWVKVSINSLCSTSDTIKVNEIDSPPDYYLFNDTTLCLGTPINITIPDGTYYNVLWYDGNNTEFTHLINQEGSYYVELLNQCDTIKKDFNIKYKDCGCYIYFPNAFTPNGDGLNDYFKPVLQCELIVYELYIYNKWGELLFEAKTSDAYWDGRYKNEYVPTGVYEWLFYYKGPYTRELQSKHGSVTVIR
ncbi:MAG: gliding motility-associated C-terminal domain-containing protein, partial [Bacteroidota bacterium]